MLERCFAFNQFWEGKILKKTPFEGRLLREKFGANRMERDNLQSRRFECKYLVSEATALAVREFVQSYLALDEYGATLPNWSYPVHSLYLDSPDLKLYQSTINGDRNRFKLRLRFYERHSRSPVYFEIKRRADNTISKQRGSATHEAVDAILAGQLPASSQLFAEGGKERHAIREFCRLVSELNARPVAHVAYLREAWMSERDNSIRVTVDREVRCEPEPSASFKPEMSNPVRVFGDHAVLELKFTNRFPDWFKELVRIHNLVQCGAAKYVDGANQIGPHRLGNGNHRFAPPLLAFFSDSSNPKHSHLVRREQVLSALSNDEF